MRFSISSCIVVVAIASGCATSVDDSVGSESYVDTTPFVALPDHAMAPDNTPPTNLPNVCTHDALDSRCWEIVLTPSLTNSWKRNIVEAYVAWSHVLGDKYHYRMVEAEMPSPAAVKTKNFIRWVQVEPSEIPGYDGYAYGSERLVKVIPIANEARQLPIATHELGHLLGLGHVEDKSIPSIMHPTVYVGDRISCHDERNLCLVWGCTVTEKCK